MNSILRDTAMGMAAAFYDAVGRSRRFRQGAPDLHSFVSANWPKYVKEARRMMALMLADKNRPEKEKQEIYDALLDDQSAETGMPNADVAFDDRRMKFDDRLVIPVDKANKARSVH